MARKSSLDASKHQKKAGQTRYCRLENSIVAIALLLLAACSPAPLKPTELFHIQFSAAFAHDLEFDMQLVGDSATVTYRFSHPENPLTHEPPADVVYDSACIRVPESVYHDFMRTLRTTKWDAIHSSSKGIDGVGVDIRYISGNSVETCSFWSPDPAKDTLEWQLLNSFFNCTQSCPRIWKDYLADIEAQLR